MHISVYLNMIGLLRTLVNYSDRQSLRKRIGTVYLSGLCSGRSKTIHVSSPVIEYKPIGCFDGEAFNPCSSLFSVSGPIVSGIHCLTISEI